MADIKYAVANSSFTAIPFGTIETAIITSDPLEIPNDNCRVCIIAYVQAQTQGTTTTVTPGIRRGSTIGGVLVGARNAENIKAPAGSTESFVIMAIDNVVNGSVVQYTLTAGTGVAGCFSTQQAIFAYVL